MGLLLFAARQSQLKNRMNELNFKLMQRQQVRLDLSNYATSIGDGNISYEDLTNCPAILSGRMTQFMFNSHNAAMMGAQTGVQQMAAAGMMSGPQAQGGASNPQFAQQQLAYNNMMMQSLYKQQKDQAAQYEANIIHQQEKQLDQEILKLENELRMVQAEYDTVKQACAAEAKNSAPAYVA